MESSLVTNTGRAVVPVVAGSAEAGGSLGTAKSYPSSVTAANMTPSSSSASNSDSGFDPIDFLNEHYTTEAALTAQLPALRESVTARMQILDDQISTALQRQSETAAQTRKHVQDAKASVLALESRIRQVQAKALQSERAVLEITADMKRLDAAKRHLQRTITALKRLHMLIHAVEQLRVCSQQQPHADYQTAAHLVDAVALLMQHFEAYTHKVQQMRLLSQNVQEYEQILLNKLMFGFRVVAFGYDRAVNLMEQSKNKHHQRIVQELSTSLSNAVMSVQVMQGGVLLVDALGEPVQVQFIHEFCQDQLGEYLQKFAPPAAEPPKPEKRISSFKAAEAKPEPPDPAAGSLTKMELRFAWFRDVLKIVEQKFKTVFPPHWNVQAKMAAMFLQLTRDHVLALLDGPRKDPDASNAPILLRALQKTMVFEKDITAWLKREHNVIFEEDSGTDKTKSIVPQDSSVSDPLGGRSDASTRPRAPIKPLLGMASAAFENYMEPYIRLEEQSMDEQLAEALEDKTVDTRGERPVFISSTNLFVFIKGSISRCTALSKGRTFYLLCLSFKDSLRKYAQILHSKLPTQPANSTPAVAGNLISNLGGKLDWNQGNFSDTNASFPKGEEVTVCHIINTCEYCADTMEALEDLIKETVHEPFKSKVGMVADQEVFHETTAKCLRVLVSGLTARTEAALKGMAALPWSTWDAVGEENVYVRTIHEEIEPVVIQLRTLLPTSYFRSFCDKFAVSFGSAYYNSLLRLKRINEAGSQQLLLDVYSLKTLFLKLPVLEGTSSSLGKRPASGSTGTVTSALAPAMYTKMVEKHFGKIETLLKLVATPADMLVENFKVQWPGGSAVDLQNVLLLKGMKRNDQTAFMEKFGVTSLTALKGSTVAVADAALERVQALQDQGYQMRQKVDDFRKAFR